MTWPVTFESMEFNPIPESWLNAPSAVDREQFDGPRIYAVSVATINSRTLSVRYGELGSDGILMLRHVGVESDDGIIPQRLAAGQRWTRSRCVAPRDEPRDRLRECERKHLREIWGHRVDEVPRLIGREARMSRGGDV